MGRDSVNLEIAGIFFSPKRYFGMETRQTLNPICNQFSAGSAHLWKKLSGISRGKLEQNKMFSGFSILRMFSQCQCNMSFSWCAFPFLAIITAKAVYSHLLARLLLGVSIARKMTMTIAQSICPLAFKPDAAPTGSISMSHNR